MPASFPDRAAAGRLLAAQLKNQELVDPLVYALPRGGVPVAVEIARSLAAPLDLLLVRKLGVPGFEELAAGSVVDGEQPEIILNDDVMRKAHLSEAEIDAVAAKELKEIERRRALYLPGRNALSAQDRVAILVDDGVATGASMKAAIAAARRRGPRCVVVAVPVAPNEALEALSALADAVVCLASPEPFRAVGLYYGDFHQLDDEEVVELLAKHDGNAAIGSAAQTAPGA